jgi:hypothetical protein
LVLQNCAQYRGGLILRYFVDSEFIENGVTIDLISIGIVCEDGREFYAENLDADLSKASDWVKENVLINLWSRQADKSAGNAWSRDGGLGGLLSYKDIAREIRRFCNPDQFGKPEFWAYYADYDWVVFCQLFGSMMDLPKGFPMYCRDIKQECDRLGNPELPKQGKGEHNALDDARWNKLAWDFLRSKKEYRVFLDGDQWCAVGSDFVNLQESCAGFGRLPSIALASLLESQSN